MSRLNTPATIDAAPAAAQTSLKAVEKQLGLVPNMFRVVANSPAALTGYLQLSAASAQGGLDAATRERIALAVAELNGCGYCLAAHSFLGRKLAKLETRNLNDYQLFGKLQALDERVGVPFGWYFFMLHGNRVRSVAGERVLEAAEAGRIVLPEHDYRVLKNWARRAYSF